ncbi:uncharacterized protein A1O9_09962 [Exophiala aquamarina CBS 119918]|uniref:Zinc/iron permease n=1 Tax=Exophiala aquamarina CBS 119918 TaxID=1182545 RepID=A0A072P385_9EURO|nr:uncharacterized protein A1O9_09962 [Exophiala aquamarina CBS 119918]KEF54167.1 hypothetical protein A1O9_09962 [Exophiala aquamarina CBS 119918]
MNCPSRTDDVELEHPTWNQNPPFLAADLTTCQDLNGIANAREHTGANNDEVDCLSPAVKATLFEKPPDAVGSLVSRARVSGHASLSKTVANGDGSNRLPTAPGKSSPATSSLRSWTTWGLSVAITSFLLSTLGSTFSAGVGHFALLTNACGINAAKAPDSRSPVPLRKRSTCPGNNTNEDLYNTPLHVGAVFIILFVSTMACSFALLAARFPNFKLPRRFFFVIRHFGTGVLIATAFVHLLPTAFISLGDQCLPGFWTEDYPAMPGAIALAGIFLVILVEMIFHPCRQIRPTSESNLTDSHPAATNEMDETNTTSPSPNPTGPLRDMGVLIGRTSSIGRSLTRVNDHRNMDHISSPEVPTDKERQLPVLTQHDTVVLSMSTLTPDQRLRKARLQCVLLEVGILFHSVFIGMALSVSIGSEFVILLIAIAFHQTFEGLALGSRIAGIDWPEGTWQPWLMALAYGCTTPIGQAIGLATHSLYSPSSETGLLVVGTMNAISAGLLTFASLVELLSEDFLSDNSWNDLRGKNRVFASLLVFFGAFAMSLVGAWA